MMYYEIDKDGFIVEIGYGNRAQEITEERFNAIREAFRDCPPDTDTHTHRLSVDIEWVSVPKEDEPTADELLARLEEIL